MGGHGSEPGRKKCTMKTITSGVRDAVDHAHIQVFDSRQSASRIWERKADPANLYPYDLLLAPDGSVYVCEFGNHRVQRFTATAGWLGCWGSEGTEEQPLGPGPR